MVSAMASWYSRDPLPSNLSRGGVGDLSRGGALLPDGNHVEQGYVGAQRHELTDFAEGVEGDVESQTNATKISQCTCTATPKAKALEIYGRSVDAGLPERFHLYLMQRAMEGGFILDVLRWTSGQATFSPRFAVESGPRLRI
jgi:hypothetical protein